MCMHAQEVLFQIRSIKKPVMFFENDPYEAYPGQTTYTLTAGVFKSDHTILIQQ